MAKNPTIAQLIAKAIELNANLTEDQAKEIIKAAGAKSYKKVAEAVEAAAKASKKKPATPKENKEVKIVEPGPRGFQFGATYVQSVIEASRIAMKEANKMKLVAFATTLGLEGITMKSDIAEAIKSMKAAAKKYLKENFEVAEEAAA
jgi:hypothetical protein